MSVATTNRALTDSHALRSSVVESHTMGSVCGVVPRYDVRLVEWAPHVEGLGGALLYCFRWFVCAPHVDRLGGEALLYCVR